MESKKLNPPVGISHVTESIEDIYRSKLSAGDRLVFHPAAQPNSFPHLGTVTTMLSTFALAKKLKDTLGVVPEILFWELENAPARVFRDAGEEYYLTLGKCVENGVSLSEKHLREFRRILQRLSMLAGVPYSRWTYSEFQAIPRVRKIILSILERQEVLAPLLCPSEQLFKVRFACPQCHVAAKLGGKLESIEPGGSRVYKNVCPSHGTYFGVLGEDSPDLFDTNTPVRALAREAYFVERTIAGELKNMMSDGADWAHYAQVNIEALHHLGYPLGDMPMRFFAPVILDQFGAKLAKSAQVGSDAYRHLPRHFVDSTALEETFGPGIFDGLWDEVSGWLNAPKRVFRNYTISYMQQVIDAPTPLEAVN